jgi:excisionase family DNA binding protein
MEIISVQEKIAWSLAEISECTGLSIAYLRNEARRGSLPVKRFGRRVLVLRDDLQRYLEKGSQPKNA